MRAALGILYGLIRAKRILAPVGRVLITPLRSAGRFALKVIGVPAYRAVFFVKRQIGRVLLPAKNRATYLVSNRYAIHVAVAAVAAVAGTANVSGGEVRAETFGTESMLYALVVQDDSASVEVVSAAANPSLNNISYFEEDGTIDPRAHLDFHSLDQDYVTTTVGGSAVSSPTIHEGGDSVAPRTNVESYQVADGDTLYGISDRFGLSLSSMLWANNMTVRSVIRPGQTLKIPPVDGVLYVIKKGDTLSKIAKTYGADQERIISFNRLSDSDDLTVGEQIVLPDGEPPTPVAVSRPAPVSQLFSDKPGSTTSSSRGSATGKGNWKWPTDWRVITQYFGWKHTGIDVDGDYTTHSYAASDGVVIYSGWRNGYGYTVEVEHGNGLVTRYGHHSKLYVKAGDAVKMGDLLAQTGTTGRSTGTHLHFEVIKNGKFQNPLDYVR
ncbi:hypothetical protein A2856_00945 [Candidatus Uhrbacteria bacterium RIFCSPHIGHO2_01_FULL_63_20]|uniref:LysM domain-containing protein n=1 Tax=Candidatus Uhrbacteria bacterium RIFCSPHIGHO2_01_FULL_63_20 TaxID=1802385 RepID=A0A1F7TN56_9BACT|nr:MAG: hypothetical protein A2856_00945 [Candidatus Uhrbacteria bacterium RIFCSPHIGHO2_01_FULL_63_20]